MRTKVCDIIHTLNFSRPHHSSLFLVWPPYFVMADQRPSPFQNYTCLHGANSVFHGRTQNIAQNIAIQSGICHTAKYMTEPNTKRLFPVVTRYISSYRTALCWRQTHMHQRTVLSRMLQRDNPSCKQHFQYVQDNTDIEVFFWYLYFCRNTGLFLPVLSQGVLIFTGLMILFHYNLPANGHILRFLYYCIFTFPNVNANSLQTDKS